MDAFSPLVPYLIGGAVGGGSIAAAALAALKWHFRQDYVPRPEITGWSRRIEDVEERATALEALAHEAVRRADTLEREQRLQWERIAENVIAPLREITQEIRGIRETQAAQATHLEYLRDAMRNP